MRKTKVEKGITLVALIITIIVLLILAVVAISAVRNDGIIDYAKNARTEFEKAQDKEQSLLDYYTAQIQSSNGEGIVHNGIIPKGGTYYVGVESIDRLDTTKEIEFTAKYVEGDKFPEPTQGDIYVYGDYEYRYKMSYDIQENFIGWKNTDSRLDVTWDPGVLKQFINKSTYGEILTTINNENIKSLTATFFECTSLKTAPTIPSTVTSLPHTFRGCIQLETAPVIPNEVTIMANTFRECVKLKNAPVIPNKVKSLANTFYGCTALKEAPEIPASVTNMISTFFNCTELSGNIKINTSNVNLYSDCFKGTMKEITLIRST